MAVKKIGTSLSILCLFVGSLFSYVAHLHQIPNSVNILDNGIFAGNFGALAQDVSQDTASVPKEKVYIHAAGAESGKLYDLDETGHAAVDPPTFVVNPDANEEGIDGSEPVVIPKYVSPSTKGLIYAELFETNPFESSPPRWVQPSDPKFNGEIVYKKYEMEAIEDDYGIRLNNESAFHAASTRLPSLPSFVGKTFVLQYEVKTENGLNCGGAYLKLLNLGGENLETFNAESPYVIMFGPDKCGTDTNKVHFIFKYKSKRGKWNEHHMPRAPSVPADSLSHLYTLVLKPDNTYEVYIDLVQQEKGNLLTDLSPPILEAKTIPDPNDVKPSDWVDAVKITDVNAVKPDDWDESQPVRIEDDEAVMPEGWLEDEEKEIPDEDIVKPEEWDDEADGEWEQPLKKNPKCETAPGCGPWKRPRKANPLYKGPWMAPLVDNPDYIGPWKPREIPNEYYFEDTNAYVLPPVDAIGFELWNVDSGIVFDNIIIANSLERAKQFADATWKVRHTVEKKIMTTDEIVDSNETPLPPKPFLQELLSMFNDLSQAYSIYFWSAIVGIVSVTAFITAKFSGTPTPAKVVSAELPSEDEDAGEEVAGTDNSEDDTNNVTKRPVKTQKKKTPRM